jgi:hypothetical protein
MNANTYWSRRLKTGLIASTILATTALVGTAHAGTVTGEVADATGTRSLQGARIMIMELGQTAEAADDGSFRFVNVPAGTYTLRVRYPGAGEQTRTIAVTDTGVINEIFALGARSTDGDEAVLDTVLVIGQQRLVSFRTRTSPRPCAVRRVSTC